MSSVQIEKDITIEKHGAYAGSVLADDGEYYKCDKKLDPSSLQPGLRYHVKGYYYEGKKTKYLSEATPIEKSQAPSTAATVPAPRRLPPPPIELAVKKPVETNLQETTTVSEPAPKVERTLKATGYRDFKHEAMGKTLSLFITGLIQEAPEIDVVKTVNIAESLVNEMDKRGWF